MTATTAVRAVLDLPVDQVHPDPDNPRGELTDIPDLAASIAQVGLLQPVVVRGDGPGRWLLVMGHRRHAAVKSLHWPTIPALTYQGTADDVLEAMLVENGQRVDLDPIDEARAVRRLIASKRLTQQQAAARIGRSEFWVSTRLLLIDQLRADEQEAVRRRDLTMGAATELARARAGRAAEPADRAWWFTLIHPLADRARRLCAAAGHSRGRRIAGGVACGQCWEQAIRDDQDARTRQALATRKAPRP